MIRSMIWGFVLLSGCWSEGRELGGEDPAAPLRCAAAWREGGKGLGDSACLGDGVVEEGAEFSYAGVVAGVGEGVDAIG